MERLSSLNRPFEKTDKNLWINKIKEELKLQDINSLAWNAGQKINIEPFYTKADLSRTKVSFFDKNFGNWKAVYKINFSDINSLKKEIEKSKKFNADHIEILIRDSQSFSLTPTKDLLQDISFTLEISEGDKNEILENIPLAGFLKLYSDSYLKEKEYIILILSTILSKKTSTGFILGISEPNEDPGTELAYSLAKAVEYFDLLTEKGISEEVILSNIHFHTSIGENFIIEIAKMRAFRSLWNKLKALLLPENSVYTTFHSELIPSMSAVKNENDEMIANTVQFMAAILGNSDFIKINNKTSAPDPLAEDFYQRIRLNIAHILREESFMNKVMDPLAGSYLIETVTSKISEIAWEKFKAIEEAGGYSEAKRKSAVN
ncbi:methylmalonyl-CoA mutase [Sporocytophaga myxococcoides]|uniref:Methylmalonyl-CoA mutase n=1 Tax=Sporocytophaga myxococcoides TaxID=153721 RepID=A0A098LJ49_9BACT|nr:methylmalonyl-CoA mutase family protein [Sporocytophaga myxococcoides]GAL86970.1 methylmalonyl-CoA mutase [Sporocytophaga myxococcoides]